MPTPPTFPTLPSFSDLPPRWKRADGRAVLAAVEASGLSPTEFARATGLDVRRIFRCRAQLRPPRPRRPARSQPTPSGPIRLVELVAHPAPAVPAAVAPVQATIAAVELGACVPVEAMPRPPELPVPAAPLAENHAPLAVPTQPVIEVMTPGGWQLRVPGTLLADLVHALSARSC